MPDAAEALRKTSVLEEAEDLHTVLTRTGSPDLRDPVAALEAEAVAREEDRPKTAPGCSWRLQTCVLNSTLSQEIQVP